MPPTGEPLAEVLAMQDRVLNGSYKLLSLLGQGGMGAVWRAQKLDLSKPVAIKVIIPSKAGVVENRARFEREAQAAAKLTSQHIVDITDYGVDGDTPYIVMEYLEGESLAYRLRRRTKLPFEETVRILSQVSKALTLAHANGIVHRDLKPQNVFIEGYQPNNDGDPGTTEVVKVLDFGIAKILDAQSFGGSVETSTEWPLGTPYYMSPEQIRDASRVDHRTDIWSLGVMAYECVTGRRPFDACSYVGLWDVIRDHITLPPSEVAAVPPGFDEWFARATACKLDERFGSIKQAIVELCAMQGNRPTPTVVDAPKVQGLAQILGDPPTVRVAPVAMPLSPSRPPEPQSVTNTPPSVGLQSTVDPSSITSPRLLNGASWRRLAVGALAAGGAAAVVGYVARTSLGGVPGEPTTSLRMLSATPSASPEAPPSASVAPQATTGPSATTTASAEPAVVPVASGIVQLAPSVQSSGAPPTVPAPAKPATATIAVPPAPARPPTTPTRATSTTAAPAPPPRSRAQKPMSQNKPAFDPNI